MLTRTTIFITTKKCSILFNKFRNITIFTIRNIKQSRQFQKILIGFYNACLWENIFGSINKQPITDFQHCTQLKPTSCLIHCEYQWHQQVYWKKFQSSLDLPDANYNYVVLFLGQMYWLFIYAPKYIFSLTTIVNCNQNFWKLSKMSALFDLPSGCIMLYNSDNMYFHYKNEQFKYPNFTKDR